MTQKERDEKLDEIHSIVVGDGKTPGLCERVRTLENKPIWTKEFIGTIISIGSVIGLMIKTYTGGGHK